MFPFPSRQHNWVPVKTGAPPPRGCVSVMLVKERGLRGRGQVKFRSPSSCWLSSYQKRRPQHGRQTGEDSPRHPESDPLPATHDRGQMDLQTPLHRPCCLADCPQPQCAAQLPSMDMQLPVTQPTVPAARFQGKQSGARHGREQQWRHGNCCCFFCSLKTVFKTLVGRE